MTPGTRLLEAVRSMISDRSMCGQDTPERMVRDALSGVRALYPAAHAIGERVSVVYPDERKPGYEDFTGTVVGVEFTDTGVNYRVIGDRDPDYTVVEAAFVQSAPEPTPTHIPMDGRRVTEDDAINRFIAEDLPGRMAEFVGTLPDVAREVYAAATGVTEGSPGEPTFTPVYVTKFVNAPMRAGTYEKGAIVSKDETGLLAPMGLDNLRAIGMVDERQVIAKDGDLGTVRIYGPPVPLDDRVRADPATVAEVEYSPGERVSFVATEARAFDPFDESFTDEARSETYSAPLTPDMPVTSTNTVVIPGRVLVQTHTDEHGVQSVATQPLCPSRSEGSPLLMCEGLADHAGPHHALARTVTW